MRAKDALGRYGEDVAARHLVEQGIVVLERNWRCERGEIDIVARDGDVLVVCEVKTRSGTGVRHAARGGHARQGRAAAPARRRAGSPSSGVHPPQVRFDVVGVLARRPRRGAGRAPAGGAA